MKRTSLILLSSLFIAPVHSSVQEEQTTHALSYREQEAATNHYREQKVATIPYRGMMMDVSRHFMSIDFLKRQIQAMSHFGLTHLHLHLTDAAGWRIESKAYPRLHQLAAWRTASLWKTWWNDGKRHYAEEGSDSAFGGYYTLDEMRQLDELASSLGVQIVPELEFPAHSEEVTAAYPELGCTGRAYECADFCLGNEATYEFVGRIIDEWNGVFSSRYIHLGGDEAGGANWMNCPKCQKVMREHGLSTRQELQQYAMQRVAKLAAERGKTMIAWDEVLPHPEADTTNQKPIIMVWRNEQTALQAMKQGHDVILCPGQYCYLDAYQDAPMNEPEAMGGYTPLEKIWMWAEEKKQSVPDSLPGRVLGLQANLWTEYVPTEQHAERMLWPRALAVSHWADKVSTRSNHAQTTKTAGEHTHMKTTVISQALPWLREHAITPFPLEKEVGQRPAFDSPIHCLSTGKPVHYIAPYHKYYGAGGERALTDGLRGGWANNDGRWQGFISRGRLDVVVDLEETKQVSRIEADFMQSIGPEIYLPEQIIISVSKDDKHYHTLYNNTCARSEHNMDYQTLGWHGSAISARYVRFQALAGNRGGWVFTDEIVVSD